MKILLLILIVLALIIPIALIVFFVVPRKLMGVINTKYLPEDVKDTVEKYK